MYVCAPCGAPALIKDMLVDVGLGMNMYISANELNFTSCFVDHVLLLIM